jgi:hypothetical protein
MKILMALMMTMTMSSAFAECKLGGECKVDADCKALNKEYAVIADKCIDPKASEKETSCAGIVGTAGAKGSAGAADASKETHSAGTVK